MGKRILIVEDEADNMVLLVHILRFMLGQDDLLTAADGHEAIRVAHDTNPDLILMDLTLPKFTGWEATRSLRASQQFKKTTILALTAHAMVGDKEKALDAGCNDYFPKPIDIDQFVVFIKPYLAERTANEGSQQNAATAGQSDSAKPVEANGKLPQPSTPPINAPVEPKPGTPVSVSAHNEGDNKNPPKPG